MKTFVEQYLKDHESYFKEVSSFIYHHPETRFEEYTSSEFLAKECEKQGFIVKQNVANIETAFTATYGSGGPVIGFLGEFDALSGLSQEPNKTSYKPMEHDVGHGCGHNLLGTGAFASACAVKKYLEENNLPGTVKFFGCPGEEGGSGKTFMVRERVFEGVDAALTWHPSPANAIMSLSSLANYQIFFRFKGTAAHAANVPHLGRSALDAVELMNVGVNYMREHVIPEARIHYAVTNTGGISPNVVQANAEVLYLIRAPKVQQVDGMYKRIKKIAEGAAMMTETEVTIEFDKACSNYIQNRSLEKILYKNLKDIGTGNPTGSEKEFAKEIWSTFNELERENFLDPMTGFGYYGDGSEFDGKYLADTISPYYESKNILAGSTDVADVSWVVPTAQLTSATSTLGTALHTWQMTSQGLSSFANRGMLRAAGSMALTGITLFESEEDLNNVKKEFQAFRNKHDYTNPIPEGVRPSKLNER
ncbi:M20 family metallopeptidase [Virgibacillus siamensis]|uniref:M20 family metallopeptidase n=1 Tax=Virgibacillus siamensis TaxID=480071 RepID=UPI000986E0EC|nr:M20 family metallopeptidase [Virgibacillus siamensis]